MGNYALQADEVVLYEGTAVSQMYKGNLLVTLTSCRVILEREKGVFKKERELLDVLPLEEVKCYQDAAQIKQKGAAVEIQTTAKNVTLSFPGTLEAKKFAGKMVDAATGTTLAQRVSAKTKSAFALVDDTLGLDTRGTIKGLLENGVKGSILNGIGKKK